MVIKRPEDASKADDVVRVTMLIAQHDDMMLMPDTADCCNRHAVQPLANIDTANFSAKRITSGRDEIRSFFSIMFPVPPIQTVAVKRTGPRDK